MRFQAILNSVATMSLAVLLSAGNIVGQTAAGLCGEYCWRIDECSLDACRVDAQTGTPTNCYYDCGSLGDCHLTPSGDGWSCAY